jgi:hypothetical protein
MIGVGFADLDIKQLISQYRLKRIAYIREIPKKLQLRTLHSPLPYGERERVRGKYPYYYFCYL